MNQKLAFLHVPKTGGTSVGTAIRAHFPGGRVHHLCEAARYDAALVTGTPHMQYATQLLPYLLAVPHLRYVFGHFGFDPRFHEHFGGDWKFITLLRDPVSRWFSHYFYDRYKTHSDRFKMDQDIATYIDSKRAKYLGNLYTKTFSMSVCRDSRTARGELDTAKEVLGRFDLIGVTEDMGLLERNFERTFGLPLKVGFERANPLPRERQTAIVEDWMVERVRDMCQNDIELYEYARNLSGRREG
jgi:hypothetical protein